MIAADCVVIVQRQKKDMTTAENWTKITKGRLADQIWSTSQLYGTAC